MQQTQLQTTQSLPSTLTIKQYEIPYLLYRFRFLTVYNLQRFFNHKNPTRIQSWVTSLKEQEYIYQFYERHNALENTKPAVYCLTSKARQLLEENPECNEKALKSLYREKKCSKQFREHWCFLANIYFMLQELYRDSKEELHFSTKRDLSAYTFFPDPLPDVYFAVTKKRAKTKRYFLELFDEKIKRKVIRERIRDYISCSENVWKEQTEDAFPFILVIASSEQHSDYLRRFIRRTLRQEFSQLQFYLTTKENLLKHGFTNDIWQKVEV